MLNTLKRLFFGADLDKYEELSMHYSNSKKLQASYRSVEAIKKAINAKPPRRRSINLGELREILEASGYE